MWQLVNVAPLLAAAAPSEGRLGQFWGLFAGILILAIALWVSRSPWGRRGSAL